MHEELKEQLRNIAVKYNGKDFRKVLERIKKERINDNGLLESLESISLNRFREKVSFSISVTSGNILEIILTITGIVLAFSNLHLAIYLSALILMTSLHPLSHYLAGRLAGIKFTHYYLNGPARIEPTLRIDHVSYLKASGRKRAMMHVSGVIGTMAAPLLCAGVAIYKGVSEASLNLFIFFVLLIVFELLTSTKIGDLMKAKREFNYQRK